jgi:hypothetical protein
MMMIRMKMKKMNLIILLKKLNKREVLIQNLEKLLIKTLILMATIVTQIDKTLTR